MMFYLSLIGMTVLGSLASVQLKKASNIHGLKEQLKNRHVYLGGLLYLLSAGLNIIALKKFDYSFVLPFTSITYIWTMIFSYYIFNEKINRNKICGIIMIAAGAIMISISS